MTKIKRGKIMRIRRKPWARPELELCPFFLNNPTKNLNKWNSYFKNNLPIYLELGCGKGGFLAQLASENKNINFIGIDLKSDMLGLAKRNIEKVYNQKNENIDNVVLLSYDIERIENVIGEQDKIDRIYINFCNPWPKPRHKKKRLTHTRQLEMYKKFLKQDGEIYFKTDDEGLFNDSLKYFIQEGFKIIFQTTDLHKENINDNTITEHEKMFTEQGIPIKALIAQKTKN